MANVNQRMEQAVQHHQAGRFAEAERLYRGVLQEVPHHPHALHLLGVLALQARRFEDARKLIEKALEVHGPHPVFHSNLAAVHLELGRLDEVEKHCRIALRLQPTLTDAHNNLGVSLRRRGRLEEAATSFREALRLQPRHVDARGSLGATLHKLGYLTEALAQLREAAQLAPNNAQVQNDLAGVLLACGQTEESFRHFKEAIRLRPNFPEAVSNLGVALRTLNRIDEAMQCFREALRLNPEYTTARNHLGYIHEIQGRMSEARAEFLEAQRIDPDNALSICNLCKLAAAGHHQLTDEELTRLRDLSARGLPSTEDRSLLYHGLAWVLDKRGEYDEAFEHCCRGNELRKELDARRGASFDPAAHTAYIDRLIATFSPEYFERVRPFGVDGELLIFVVGMPRSGTTLVEQILASHPLVHGAGELPHLEGLIASLPRHLGTDEQYPQNVHRLEESTARSLADRYLQEMSRLSGSASRLVDKMPLNLHHLGLIATFFPRARIVHCRRDAVDTCLSCYFQNFANPLAFSRDLHHLGRFYREFERLMAHWSRVLPVPIHELRYEELIADQEGTSRRLIEYCGLEWDERCLRFHESQREVRTASVLQVRQPIYGGSVGRWKRYEKHLRPLLESLNLEVPHAPSDANAPAGDDAGSGVRPGDQ